MSVVRAPKGRCTEAVRGLKRHVALPRTSSGRTRVSRVASSCASSSLVVYPESCCSVACVDCRIGADVVDARDGQRGHGSGAQAAALPTARWETHRPRLGQPTAPGDPSDDRASIQALVLSDASQGLEPEVVASTFNETLPHGQFADELSQYAVATATEKAVEVYTRLVEQSPDAPPDMVIGADTIIMCDGQILEKPGSRAENLRMLLELNGRAHDVVTAVTVIWPILANPGYGTASLCETTHVHFAEHERTMLEAYCDAGEGVDRAGGYAIQGRGALLVQRIEGGASRSIARR